MTRTGQGPRAASAHHHLIGLREMAAMASAKTPLATAAPPCAQPRPNRGANRRRGLNPHGLRSPSPYSSARAMMGSAASPFAHRTRAAPEAAPEMIDVDGTASTDDEIPAAVGTASKDELMRWLTDEMRLPPQRLELKTDLPEGRGKAACGASSTPAWTPRVESARVSTP